MSRLVFNPKTNTAHKLNDVVMINGGKEAMEYIRSFSIGELDKKGKYTGQLIIFECPDGSFRHQDGSVVKDKKYLKNLPPDYYNKAMAWLKDQKFAEESGAADVYQEV